MQKQRKYQRVRWDKIPEVVVKSYEVAVASVKGKEEKKKVYNEHFQPFGYIKNSNN